MIGLIAFIISTILAILLGFPLGAPLAIFVIAFPILMIILLLILTIFLKVASMLLKGKGGFSEECGILGIVGSSYLILMVLLMVAIYTPMLLVFAISGPGGFGVVMALMYLIMGVAYLIFMPLVYLIMAFTFDLLADIEQISIYRSGAIVGLMFGIIMFLMMLMLSAMMFLIGGGYVKLFRNADGAKLLQIIIPTPIHPLSHRICRFHQMWGYHRSCIFQSFQISFF